MRDFERGDVVRVPFPYTDRSTRQHRPGRGVFRIEFSCLFTVIDCLFQIIYAAAQFEKPCLKIEIIDCGILAVRDRNRRRCGRFSA